MKTNIQQSISRVNTACYSPRTHLNPGFFLVECRSLPLVLSLSGIENIKTFQLSYGVEEGSLTDKYCFLLRTWNFMTMSRKCAMYLMFSGQHRHLMFKIVIFLFQLFSILTRDRTLTDLKVFNNFNGKIVEARCLSLTGETKNSSKWGEWLDGKFKGNGFEFEITRNWK